MKRLFQIISIIALLFTVIPSILYLSGDLNIADTKLIMLISTIVWFVFTPLWLGKNEKQVNQT